MDRMYRIIAAINTDTALPEDLIVNTWHFRHTDVSVGTTPEDSANDMIDQLEEFYQAIDGVLFPTTVGTTIQCKAYDLNDAEPRVPVLTRSIAITPNTGEPMPHEVAICLSLKADVESGEPAGRRRGRVYLGPLVKAAASVDSNRVVFSNDYRNAVRDAAIAAFLTGLTSEDPKLHVYSRTTDLGGATVANSFFRVVRGEVDNAFDTQRRRGHAPSAKTTFDLA